MLPSLSLPPLEFCLGTSPIQAEKSRPDRKAFGSATLATSAVAGACPTPGISSSRLLVSLDRCQAIMRRSNSRICAFSIRNCAPRATTQSRAVSGTRSSLGSAATSSSSSTPLRPTGATMPSSARCALIEDDRILLAHEEVARTMQHEAALLFCRLGLDKPHVWSNNRFADRLGIGGIVLLAFEVGLHVRRRHQADGVTKGLQRPRPVM